MKYVLVDENDIVVNTIMYNGIDPYTPPRGLILKQANEWITIGHHIDTVEPVYPVISDEEAKASRDEIAAGKIEVVAAFAIEQKSNPDLTFTDYLDSLEAKANDLQAQIKASKNQPLPAN